MTPAEAVSALRPWIDRHERPCWKPIVKSGDGSVTASKFGGLPWLDAHESWPQCKRCSRPMELFLQLNLDELPAELSGRFGSGLLQLFYCSWSYLECDGDRGWEAFANTSSLARVIIPSEETNCRSTANRYLPKRIVSWKKTIDRPDPIEHEELGIKIDYHFNTVPYHPTEMRCPELGLHFVGMPYVDELHDQVASHPGDKLGGWPHWVQGPEYPACPSCGKKMQFVFQIGSEDNIPFMFGDCGTGHVTQCQEHKDIVAFAWACC